MKNNKTFNILLYFLLSVSLISCGNNLSEGTVIAKVHQDANTNLVLIPIVVGKTTIFQQYWVYDDEDWIITIEGNSNGDIETEKVYVTEETYNKLSNGDFWVKTESCNFTDKDIKEKHK